MKPFGLSILHHQSSIINQLIEGECEKMICAHADVVMSGAVQFDDCILCDEKCLLFHSLCPKLHAGSILIHAAYWSNKHCALFTAPHPIIQYSRQARQLPCSVLASIAFSYIRELVS